MTASVKKNTKTENNPLIICILFRRLQNKYYINSIKLKRKEQFAKKKNKLCACLKSFLPIILRLAGNAFQCIHRIKAAAQIIN